MQVCKKFKNLLIDGYFSKLWSIPRFKDDVSPDTDRGSSGGGVPSLLNFVNDAGRDIREALDQSAPGRRLVDHRRYLQRQLRCRYSYRDPAVPLSCPDPGPATVSRNSVEGDQAGRFRCVHTDCFRTQLDKERQFTSFPVMTKAILDKGVSSTQPEADASCGSHNGAPVTDSCCHWPTGATGEAAHDSSRRSRCEPGRDENDADGSREITKLSSGSAKTTTVRSAVNVRAADSVRPNRSLQNVHNAEINNDPLTSANNARRTTPEATPQPACTGSKSYSPSNDGQSDTHCCTSGSGRGTIGRLMYCQEGHDNGAPWCRGWTGHWTVEGRHTKKRALTENRYDHADVSLLSVRGMSTPETVLPETEPALHRLLRTTPNTRERRGERNDREDTLVRMKAGFGDRDPGCSCHYVDKTEPGTENNNSHEHPKQIPLRQRHLPASFWKEPNVPKLPPPLPPEYIAAAFYGTRKYDGLSVHALSHSNMDMLAYKHISAYSYNGINGYPPCLSESQRPYSLSTEQFYNALASRYSPEFYASLHAAAVADTSGERATWTRPGDGKSPVVGDAQRRSYVAPTSHAGRVAGRTAESRRCLSMDYNGTIYDKANGVAGGDSARHQRVWKPIPTKSITASFGSRFHPFAGVR